METREFVTKWVLDTVQETYPDDIALVVSHSTLSLEEGGKFVSYFVPITDKGRGFAQTFILNGIGFDIWGIEWERLERFAALEEYNITCLADGEILYSRTKEDADRFYALQKKQRENLSDPVKMRANALEAYGQAKAIYLEMLFAKGGDIKLGAGYVLDYLAQAIAYTNLRYFQHSQTRQLEELASMAQVPEGFAERYSRVIRERDGESQKKLCYELIWMVKEFLDRPEERQRQERNFQDLADWYGELSYTWLRIRYYCGKQDADRAYMWGIYLQEELNHVCGDFGLEKMDLMDSFDPDALDRLAARGNELENKMRAAIDKGGGIIREYPSTEVFLREI